MWCVLLIFTIFSTSRAAADPTTEKSRRENAGKKKRGARALIQKWDFHRWRERLFSQLLLQLIIFHLISSSSSSQRLFLCQCEIIHLFFPSVCLHLLHFHRVCLKKSGGEEKLNNRVDDLHDCGMLNFTFFTLKYSLLFFIIIFFGITSDMRAQPAAIIVICWRASTETCNPAECEGINLIKCAKKNLKAENSSRDYSEGISRHSDIPLPFSRVVGETQNDLRREEFVYSSHFSSDQYNFNCLNFTFFSLH